MDRLKAVSISATREHALELTLKGMKEEWEKINFTTQNVRWEAMVEMRLCPSYIVARIHFL